MIAIDLGSNTIRFIEYDGIKWGRSYEKVVRAAEGLQASNRIGENAIKRILAAINEAQQRLNFSNHEVVAVTTAAIRMASNGVEVISSIYLSTGILFTIIDGVREARLTLFAVQNRLKELNIIPDSFVLSDIGGGSTELIYYDDDKVVTKSFPIGIVTMSEQALNNTHLQELLDDFEKKVALFYASLEDKADNARLILTSGTPTTIAAYRMGMYYANYDPHKINGSILTVQDCILTHKELMSMDESTRACYVGVGREQVISTGILMIESLFKGLNIEEAIIVDDGLREGVALDYFHTKSIT